MITFTHVSKKYGDDTALSNVTFSIRKGEMAFLTGRSGAGKSTILKLAMRIEPVTRGQIIINNHPLEKLSKRQVPHLRRDIGMIFQDPHLLDDRTVFENVAIPLIITGYKERDIKKRVQAALDKVGLLSKSHLLPSALSTGEKQRIGIARAVVNKPTILLGDEPTGNLDPELSIEIFKLFEAFNAVGVTVLVATHDISLINQIPHRTLFLKNGVIEKEAI